MRLRASSPRVVCERFLNVTLSTAYKPCVRGATRLSVWHGGTRAPQPGVPATNLHDTVDASIPKLVDLVASKPRGVKAWMMSTPAATVTRQAPAHIRRPYGSTAHPQSSRRSANLRGCSVSVVQPWRRGSTLTSADLRRRLFVHGIVTKIDLLQDAAFERSRLGCIRSLVLPAPRCAGRPACCTSVRDEKDNPG